MAMGTGRADRVHEAGFYASDAEFRAMILPWVEDAIGAGEPVVIGYDERKADLLRSWLSRPEAVSFIADRSLYATPARAIETYRRMFARHFAAGAPRVRIAGDVPHPGKGGRFQGWDRYEMAINSVWHEYTVWSRCLYEATSTSELVRDVVERTHPQLLTPSGGRAANSRYQSLEAFRGLSTVADPVTVSMTPSVELADAAPAEARRELARTARGLIHEHVLDDLTLGVSEAVSNAREHGRSHARLRIWAVPGRVVAHIHDGGSGTSNPLAGLIPATASATGAGLGLWITHQLDLVVDLLRGPDGFTVQLIAEDR